MANKIFKDPATVESGLVIVAGSFAPAGSGAVTDVNGRGFSVARTGTGEFTITFDDKYPSLVSATATLQLASADDQVLHMGTYTAASKTLLITVWDISGEGAADIAADANNRVHFTVIFKNTDLP